MELIKLEQEKEIDNLSGGEFLQSYFWSELIRQEGDRVERWGVKDKGELSAAITIVYKPLFGGFFYCYAPRGPIGRQEAISFLLSELKKKNQGSVFLRLEPSEDLDKMFTSRLKKSLDLQPKKTLCLDLRLGQAEILKAMHPKTRYNIKLAEKKGVKISQGTGKDFSEFWRLMTLTGARDGFRLHSAKHYQNLLNDSEHIKLFFASSGDRNIATGLFCFFSDRVTYLHGASDNEARNLMAPYLLQWEVIKQAQTAGYKYYDFYGIDEKKWPGVTRFKLGFGGFIKEYPGTYDLIFRPAIYSFYEFLRKLRRLIK
jgi:lipid II:glycine glycyltransferase (peptidoglycan interpeptide bridge formation enzyme)